MYDLEAPQSRTSSPQNFSGGFPQFEDENEERKEDGKQSLENRDGSKVLPFEFVALEACLEAACSCLENEVFTLTFYFESLSFPFFHHVAFFSRLLSRFSRVFCF